ncbi:trypsin-like serine protease, partial [Escherichia coli]|nr:trypsin-like serine protease [Escherichia coli]
EFPYAVAFLYTYPGPGITVQRCVGSLLSSLHVLTSGFCYTGAILENFQIRAGSTSSLTGGTLVGIRTCEKHPGYVESPRRDDIAITFLDRALRITD